VKLATETETTPSVYTMSEYGGITELQLLEQQIAILKRIHKGIDRANPTSEYCPQLLQKIQASAELDGFVVNPEAAGGSNQYHGSGGSAGGGGCCVAM
jgi:hypothetical protein